MRFVLLLPVALTMAYRAACAVPAMAQDMSVHDHGGRSPLEGPAGDGRWSDGQWGHGHAQNHDWYKDLKQPGTNYSCCNGDTLNGDCRPTRAYKDSDGTWRALVDGHWQPVPPSVVLQTLAPDGNSHVCAGKSGMIYCFIGGVPKS